MSNCVIENKDCVQGMREMERGSVDLVFADPPWNIGKEYKIKNFNDKKPKKEYLDWCDLWIGKVYLILKEGGAFWLSIGDEYVAELKILCEEYGLSIRNWVIWHYTFGVNCKNKFSRSHSHFLYFVKGKNFTFNSQDIRVPSARQKIYGDKRAANGGKVPDDTWILRPQDMGGFDLLSDTWDDSRICGTFKERNNFNVCQIPEKILERIVLVSSNPGDLVVDPFSGTGTTAVICKRLGRNFNGFELSTDCYLGSLGRLASENSDKK